MVEPIVRKQGVIWSVLVLLFLSSLPGVPRGEALERDDIDEAVFLAASGDYEGALLVFQKYLKRKPDDALLHYYVGVTSLFLNHLDEADRYLTRSVKLEAPFPEAYYWLAHSLLARDRKSEAARVLAKGLSRFPSSEKLKKLSRELKLSMRDRDQG